MYFSAGGGGLNARTESTSSDCVVSSTLNYADLNYHQVAAVVKTGISIDLYVDGRFSATSHVTTGTNHFSTFNILAFGMLRDSSPSNPFNGCLDNVLIWNKALTAIQIAELYRVPFITGKVISIDNYIMLSSPPSPPSPSLYNTIFWGTNF